MTRMGRKPLATGHVDRLQGSEPAKQRLAVLLETLHGVLPVPEACATAGDRRVPIPRLARGVAPGSPGAAGATPAGTAAATGSRSAVAVAHPGLGGRESDAASAVGGSRSAAGTG